VTDDFFGRVAFVKGMKDHVTRRSYPLARVIPPQSAPTRIKRCILLDSAVFPAPIVLESEEEG
jgi:hypothetical protein